MKSPCKQPVKTVTGLKALKVELHRGKGDTFFSQMTIKKRPGIVQRRLSFA